ncbi:GNAT family N-acetyltransferase [Psychrobacillus vulpis]|uniref:GNAT family N-acetyltransferase n=1 Tax=Psychrobacillus vulpis TaxID=2325572 RepID=A0A544TI98_9BACI|nr:GNAT family protein [Psychrobacillus vulpis]TQR17179.1 GNAT family N-acetyltransferase [Psychrobacillus vulpis]
MKIREVTPADAEKLVALINQVEVESPYMLMEPGERKMTPESQRLSLEQMEKESNSTIFVAEEKEELVGYLIVIGGKAKRKKHTAYLVIGIIEKFRGQGIGTKLFQQLDDWAAIHQIQRLELTVVTENTIGVALYKKMGFESEGIKRKSLLVNGKWLDEYYMSKLR